MLRNSEIRPSINSTALIAATSLLSELLGGGLENLLILFAKKTKKPKITHSQQKANHRKNKRSPDKGSNKSERGRGRGGGRRGGK